MQVFKVITPKAQATEETDKLGYSQFKNFYAANGTNEQVKRQPTECEKILQVTQLIRDLYPEYIKNHYHSTIK
jgi:hypothetical protein